MRFVGMWFRGRPGSAKFCVTMKTCKIIETRMFSESFGQNMCLIIKIAYYGGINCTIFVILVYQENPLFMVFFNSPPVFSICRFVSIPHCKISERSLPTQYSSHRRGSNLEITILKVHFLGTVNSSAQIGSK